MSPYQWGVFNIDALTGDRAQHICPVKRGSEHALETHRLSPECACKPVPRVLCTECPDTEVDPSCWKCGGHGTVPHDGAPVDWVQWIHNDPLVDIAERAKRMGGADD